MEPSVGQIDHDLDHLIPHLLSSEVVQDLHNGTDPTRERCAMIGRADYMH